MTDDLELTIIGIILRHPEKILEVQIESRWFLTYRKVIKEMQKISAEGIEIDVFVLHERLKTFELRTVVYWHTQTYGSEANLSVYVNKLRDLFISNGIKQEFSNALNKFEKGDLAKDVLSQFMGNVDSIQNSDSKVYNYEMKDALLKFTEEFTDVFEGDSKIGLELGIPSIDEALGGFLPTDLMIVGARPAVGKTSFALTVIRNIAIQGKRIGFFSTEMGVTQVMQRLISMDSHITGTKIRKAIVDEQEITRICASAAKMSNYNIRICDKPSITASEIMMQSRAWHMFGGLDFVVVDYLTRIRPDKDMKNQNLNVGEIATTMKNIARVLKVPVMVLAQLNRASDTRSDKRPKMSDLRDSGIIEQEADQILLLHRPSENEKTETESVSFADKYKTNSKPITPQFDEIIIDKNRHGETGSYRVDFQKHLAMWVDY